MLELLMQVQGSPSGTSAARTGTGLAQRAAAGGGYPLLVVGGVVILVAVFVLLVKMKREG